MVSLADRCFIVVRENLEKEKYSNTLGYTGKPMHDLPLKMRRLILETIFMRSTINNPGCSEALSSPEFLNGLTELNTQRGGKNDENYLNRIADSLSTIASNGKTIGAGVTKLHLNLYERIHLLNGSVTYLNEIANVISQCPNLIVLGISLAQLEFRDPAKRIISENHGRPLFKLNGSEGGLLNKLDAFKHCQVIIENLGEFCFDGIDSSFKLINDGPVLRLKNLTTLRLSNGQLHKEGWFRFLGFIENTLTDLHLTNVTVGGDVHPNGLLSKSLPQLKRLTIDDRGGIRCRKLFVEKLIECSNLEYVFLSLIPYGASNFRTTYTEDEEGLNALAKIKTRLVELKICIRFDRDAREVDFFDEFSRLKVVDLLKEKISDYECSDFWVIDLNFSLEITACLIF